MYELSHKLINTQTHTCTCMHAYANIKVYVPELQVSHEFINTWITLRHSACMHTYTCTHTHIHT